MVCSFLNWILLAESQHFETAEQLYKQRSIQRMQSEEITEFDLSDFYDILMSVSIKEKLKPFIKQFKKKNMSFIYETIVNILQVINSKKEAPLMKFNALMATKLFFDTGEYVPIVLIQIYLLPIIYEIASYRIQKRSQQGLTFYFIEQGYDPTKEMKRIGFNFVLLALQFMFMSAQVKPYRNLENQQLQQPSNYATLSKVLVQKGVQPIKSYKFYLPSYVNQTRKRFIKKLNKFNPDDYVDFFLKLTCDEINLNKKAELDLKKMISYGDAYFTIPLMNLCEDELTNMDTNFPNKKKYLNLLGEFMKGGDIYAVLIITRSTFLQAIYEKIQSVKGEIGLDAGYKIYPQVEAPKAEKKQFYIEFLKNIEIWAHCHPVDEDGDPTDSKKIYDVLKTHKKFVFPANILLSKIRSQMQANLKLNNNRNEKMIRLVDDLSSFQSRRKASLEMKQSRASRKSDKNKGNSILNSYIQFDQLEEMLIKAKKKLDLICIQQQLPETIAFLQKFKTFWAAMEQRNEIDADESDNIELVIEQGSLCCKIIDILLPVYSLYNKGSISFEEYLERVNLLMKTDEQEEQASIEKGLEELQIEQVSVQKECSSNNSKIQQFQSSHSYSSKVKKSQSQYQLKSKISEKVRQSSLSKQSSQQIFNDYEVDFRPKEPVPAQKKKNPFSKPQTQIKESFNDNDSIASSRSSRSRPNNQNILQRRINTDKNASKPSKLSQQPQYKDIIKNKKDNKKGQQLQKEYQSNDSFISSEHSSLKENKRQSQLQESRNGSNDLKMKVPSIEDYYGIQQDKNSYVGFGSSSSSKMKLSRSKAPLANKKSNRQGQSVISKDNSQVNSYSDNTFKIQTDKNQQKLKSSSKISVSQGESGFSFTSKEDKKKSFDRPLSLISKYDQQSQIQEPELKALVHSFHEAKEEEPLTNSSKITTFKDCFHVHNEIISSKEDKEKIFALSRGKIVNFIETVYSKQTPKNSSIVDMLSQRNAKLTIESYRNERQKYREIQSQSQKIKSLQSFNKNMRMKFIMKRPQPYRQQQYKPPNNNQSQPVSFYQSSECSMRKSEANLNLKTNSRQFLATQRQIIQSRVINTKIYSHYFSQSKSDKVRKCMLKSKSLLLKNDEFQIGYVNTKRQNSINVSLFITPLKGNIEDVNLLLAHDQNITLKISANYIQQIKVNTQESINLQISIENVPYVLPSLNLKFKTNKNYTHNQMLITIPSSFNKFCEFNQLSTDISQHFESKSSSERVKVDEFKFSSKLLNADKIQDNLKKFSLIEREKHSSTYGSEVYFKGKIYLVRFTITDNGRISMEGVNMTGDHKNTKFLEFLLITFHTIFQSSKNFK